MNKSLMLSFHGENAPSNHNPICPKAQNGERDVGAGLGKRACQKVEAAQNLGKSKEVRLWALCVVVLSDCVSNGERIPQDSLARPCRG